MTFAAPLQVYSWYYIINNDFFENKFMFIVICKMESFHIISKKLNQNLNNLSFGARTQEL